MGLNKPADRGVVARLRAVAAACHRHMVRYEPAYILPWVASTDVETFVLLENNQIEYSRRRRGLATSVSIDVRRYDSCGRVTLERTVDVKPGAPVALGTTSDRGELKWGFYQLTDSSQYYVQIRGSSGCALTHGRSTVIAHYPAGAAPLLRLAARLLRPYRKGFNFIYTHNLYETVLLMNLSSSINIIDIDATYERTEAARTRVALPPFGSYLTRFNAAPAQNGDVRTGFARMRGSGPFDFYVLQTRLIGRHETFSIQHVN